MSTALYYNNTTNYIIYLNPSLLLSLGFFLTILKQKTQSSHFKPRVCGSFCS